MRTTRKNRQTTREFRLMRRFIGVLCAALVSLTAHAQLLSPESVTGALIGGIAGGVIGHNHHRQTAEGAAIGAGAGLLLGTLYRNAREEANYRATQVPVPTATYSPFYSTPTRPNYAVAGTILGGIVGGVIGHNHHRQTAEGIAIGAASGLVLGTLAEQEARKHERTTLTPTAYTVVQQPSTVVVQQPVQQPVQQQVQQPQPAPAQNQNSNHSSPLAGANSLFGR